MGPQTSLNAYLREIANKPFRLGRHDCLTFTNEAWLRMYGHKWAGDWEGRYKRSKTEDELRAEFGYDTLEAAVSARLTPCVGIPPRGALVTGLGSGGWLTGKAFGISVGTNAAFLSGSGVVYLPITDIEMAWVEP
jgi:hypothetical protein